MAVRSRLSLALSLVLFIVPAPGAAGAGLAQSAVKASGGHVSVTKDGTTATAVLTVQNGTMYDVYVVGAQTDAAGAVEIRQAAPAGEAAAVKEVPVPAYGALEMSTQGVHLLLKDLKRPLKAGDTVTLTVFTDAGERIDIAAKVK